MRPITRALTLGAALLFVLPGVAGAAPQAAQQSFGSCADARAAGYSDIGVGEPGYSQQLDRDGDGLACDQDDQAVVATTTPAPVPDAVAQPAPVAEVLGTQETAADTPTELASTGASSWILTGVAALLVLGGVQLVRSGYDRLDWITGRRFSEVRFTVESDRHRRSRRSQRRYR